MFGEGTFKGQYLQVFPARKRKQFLTALGRCAFCGRSQDEHGRPLKLTSEHVIPEALNAGLEVPQASCDECQVVTSTFERTVIEEMFDPVRRSLSFVGKTGVLQKSHFPVDIGTEKTELAMVSSVYHPTILTMPKLYPASSYSGRPYGTNGLFNILTYNINCKKNDLEKYGIERFCTQTIDTARFCQMIAKTAHILAVHHYGYGTFEPLVSDLVRTALPEKTPSSTHYDHVGSLWQAKDQKSSNLHEVEVGTIEWQGISFIAARVRLFAIYEMPSYHVAVGRPFQLSTSRRP